MKLLITGEGRSGTKWLATLLKESGFDAGHETGLGDAHHLRKPWREPNASWTRGKLPGPGIVREAIGSVSEDWIEVDGHWHFYAPTFLALGVPVLHLVRDGRDVVRSFLARRKRRVLFDAPKGLDYFGQLCWRWNYKVLWLANLNLAYLRLEDALTDFELLGTILGKFDCQSDEEVWQTLRETKVNETEKHVKPVYSEWEREEKRTFWQMCSLAMGRYGYRGKYPYKSN